MARWQDEQLHRSLNRAAYHDNLRDIEYHRRHDHYDHGHTYYQTPGFSFGIQNRNFSLYFGR